MHPRVGYVLELSIDNFLGFTIPIRLSDLLNTVCCGRKSVIDWFQYWHLIVILNSSLLYLVLSLSFYDPLFIPLPSSTSHPKIHNYNKAELEHPASLNFFHLLFNPYLYQGRRRIRFLSGYIYFLMFYPLHRFVSAKVFHFISNHSSLPSHGKHSKLSCLSLFPQF